MNIFLLVVISMLAVISLGHIPSIEITKFKVIIFCVPLNNILSDLNAISN